MKKPLLISIILAWSGTLAFASTNLLPGLRFEDPLVKLQGSLVFLYHTSTNAAIYEFNLEKKSLRMITDSPGGSFWAAKDGRTFCVLYGGSTGSEVFGTNAFIYSDRLHLVRRYTFEKSPGHVTFANNHVFFYFDFDHWAADYDIASGTLKPALVPGEKTVQGGVSNLTVAASTDFGHQGFKASDGRWIFFEGREAPLAGTKLVSSLLDQFYTSLDDPKGTNVHVLKRFSRPLDGWHNLDGMSPDGYYAFIRQCFTIGYSWGNTYYVVNATNGKTHVLLEDKVAKIDGHSVSYMYWRQ